MIRLRRNGSFRVRPAMAIGQFLFLVGCASATDSRCQPSKVATPAPSVPRVDTGSLLASMADRQTLAHRARPWFHSVEFSSFDRKSLAYPYASEDAYRNEDRGQFLRIERRNDRTEYVMVDASGPGALVRLWSANIKGTLRFYFDGEENPRLEVDGRTLLSGGDPHFPAPFGQETAQGLNLDFPFPFASMLKVTLDNAEGDLRSGSGVYYQASVQIYDEAVDLQSFRPTDLVANEAICDRVRNILLSVDSPSGEITRFELSQSNSRHTFNAITPSSLVELSTTIPFAIGDDIRIRLTFDGETTVDLPLRLFFGNTRGEALHSFYMQTLPERTADDQRLDPQSSIRFAMPFAHNASIEVVGMTARSPALSFEVRIAPDPSPCAYRFAARHASSGFVPSRPLSLFRVFEEHGSGQVVASLLRMENRAQYWWGEGDERIRVDGETTPSWIGTGTEDYYGYAWGDRTIFQHPLRAQSRTGNENNEQSDWSGVVVNHRIHQLDPIAFQRSIQFDFELWQVSIPGEASYDFVTYAYLRRGETEACAPPSNRRETCLGVPVSSPW